MNFVSSDLQLVNELVGSYDPVLVVMSVLIAIAASYSAFQFSQQSQIENISRIQRYGWLLSGALSLGGGIWVMHVLGMLAYELPIKISYDGSTTFLSVIPAIVAGFVVLKSAVRTSVLSIVIRSVVMGLCIGMMHYIGMTAMHLNANTLYSIEILLLSIIVAVPFLMAAIALKQQAFSHCLVNAGNKKEIFIASALMGLAISSIHYIGMAAIHFIPSDITTDHSRMLSPLVLALSVGLVLLGVLILMIISLYLTQRFTLLNELKQSRFRLEMILDSTIDAILILNKDGEIESCNAATENIFGYEEGEITGKSITVLLDVTDGGSALLKINKTFNEKNSCIINNSDYLYGVSKSGCKFSIDFAINHVDIGGYIQFICVIRDITERKATEIALSDSAARVAAVVDTVPDAIFTFDKNGVVNSMNPSAEEIFGYFIGEIEGGNISLLIPGIHERCAVCKETRLAIVSEEAEGMRKCGERFPIELSINEYVLGGLRYFTCVSRDITARKASERELEQHRGHLQALVETATSEIRAIVKTAVNGVISIDQYGIVNIFNPAAEKMFGWQASEVVGQNVAMIVPNIDTDTHDNYIKRYLETHEAHIIGSGREVSGLRKDGSIFPLHLAVGHAELGQEKQLFVAFITDITEQKNAEKELLMAKEHAEQAARVKADFLANMSHEIRTPMNAVIGFSEVVLQDQTLSDNSKQHVNTILNSGKNLLGIINDILDFSKIEAGKVSLETVCFHLPNAIRDALRTFEFKVAEKGLELKLIVFPDVPLRVMGDPARLRQVILNLIGNAIKFTPSGCVTLTVAPEEGTQRIQFSVSDTGIGMSDKQVAEVFEAFSQADTSTNRRFGGTGLGTTISKQIVELMDGKIWAESQQGKGSIFHFTAVLENAHDSLDCLFENDTFVEADYCSPRAFKVLLAEDIPENATLAMLRLEQQGHKITWCENGRIAVDAISRDDYDIVLMDIQMPEVDGLRATAMIRQLTGKMATVPIIALTASVMEEEQQDCFDAGMNVIVGKPINFSELLSTMEALVPEAEGDKLGGGPVVLSVVNIEIDFTPLAGMVDYDKGISIWKEPLVYATALINFSNEHENDITEIIRLLSDGEDGLAAASSISHALKGLSGNLCINSLSDCISKVDALLKENNIAESMVELTPLGTVMESLVIAISSIELPEEYSENNELFDSGMVADLITRMINALDELNPEVVMPHVLAVEKHLGKPMLNSIRRNINNFDFDIAREEAIKLSDKVSREEQKDI